MLKNSGKVVTIYDIAAELGLSTSTVSRSLNNSNDVNKKTLKRVLDASCKMGYTSNLLASGLRNRRSNTIGVIIPRLNSAFMSGAIAGIENIINQAGYNLVISQSLENVDKEVSCTESMLSNRVAGLIVSLAGDIGSADHFESFEKHGVPVVFFDRVYDNEKYLNIQIDNFKAAYTITDHLAKQGCREIIHITANRLHTVYQHRVNGYLSALENNDIAFNEKMLIKCDLSDAAGKTVAKQILSMRSRPDGIFSANDVCAIGCLTELKKSGISIPEDIAVAGFNDDPDCCLIEPNLTTIGYDAFGMGELSARVMLEQLSDSFAIPARYSVFMPYHVIIRESTKKEKDRVAAV